MMTMSMMMQGNEKKPLYKNPQAPIEQRVEDLLGRMTLEEKVGQMNQLVGIVDPKRTRFFFPSRSYYGRSQLSSTPQHAEQTADSTTHWY